jgi:hypothetical protein
MIDFGWWISHLSFAVIGGCAGFAIAAALAMSSEVSRWEETQPAQVDDSELVAALKAELAEERANVEFYCRMATERM